MNKVNRSTRRPGAPGHTAHGWRGALRRLVGWWHRRGARPALAGAAAPGPVADPQARLLAIQHFLAEAFEGCWSRMSGRDQRLYRQLIRTTSLETLVALRFESFDLMCRLLGEGVARAHQRRIDTWLPARR